MKAACENRRLFLWEGDVNHRNYRTCYRPAHLPEKIGLRA